MSDEDFLLKKKTNKKKQQIDIQIKVQCFSVRKICDSNEDGVGLQDKHPPSVYIILEYLM